MDEQQPKISLPEAIIMIMIVGLSDLFEALIDLTGVGIIIGEFLNFTTGAILQFWLFMKGIKGFWKLGTNLIGTVADGVTSSFFPVKTLTLLLTIYLVNRPPKAVEKIAKITGTAKGKIGAVGGKMAEAGEKMGGAAATAGKAGRLQKLGKIVSKIPK